MTGFSKDVRTQVVARASGYCERCGQVSFRYEIHHRRPRGMGGSKAADTNTAANALLVCVGCHREIEADRAAALKFGWLVRQGQEPAGVAVFRRGTWVLLQENGGVFVPPRDSGRCSRCGFHAKTQGHRAGCQVAP